MKTLIMNIQECMIHMHYNKDIIHIILSIENNYGEYYSIALASIRRKKKTLWMILHFSIYQCKTMTIGS